MHVTKRSRVTATQRLRGVASGALMAVTLILGGAALAFAHHGYSVEYDESQCLDLRGTISNIKWENPHAYLEMDVKDAGGKTVTWHLELVTPSALQRFGTQKRDFLLNMGKPAVARICATKPRFDGTRGVAEYLKMADGVVRRVGQIAERDLTPEKLSFYGK